MHKVDDIQASHPHCLRATVRLALSGPAFASIAHATRASAASAWGSRKVMSMAW